MLKGKGRIIKLILAVVFIGILAGGSASFLVGLAAYKSLPTIEEIRNRTVAQSTKIYDREGEVILYELGDSQKRTLVSLQDMPDSLKNATVAIEDERFWDNNRPVVDWRGIVRAIYANLTSGAIVQGGSTITQQLAKKAFLSDERTWDRKAKELLLAFRLSREYSKEKILEMYLNEIPYGATIYGVEAAARSYFGKDLKDLNEAESAVIASIPKAPTYYNPWGSHRKQLLERKDVVLKKMYDLGYLSKENYERATKLPIKFQPQSEGILAPHFSLMVQEYLVEKYGEELVRTGGLKVITTLDWKIQQAAEKAVLEGAQRNTELYKGRNSALVARSPKTGEVLALVGSKDYFDSENEGNFNVATQGLRQPGSALKPFIYLTDFAKGMTPETILFDVPTEFVAGDPSCPPIPDFQEERDDACFHPQNFDHEFRGPVSVREALAQSLNIPAVKALYLAGLKETIENVSKFGLVTLNNPKRYGLSLVLGGGEVTLLNLVEAYGVLASEGLKQKTLIIKEVRSTNGEVLEKSEVKEGDRVADPEGVRQINSILSDPEARRGLFGSSLNLTTLKDHPSALKTGTSNDYRDAWVVGYTPEIVAGVWAGNNNNQPMQKQGGSILAAVPIWHAFMSSVIDNFEATQFNPPAPYTTGKAILDGVAMPEGRAHSELYYINKDDIKGPAPSDPSTDRQFYNWETAVQAWASNNPEKIQSGNISGVIKINSPLDGSFISSTINIKATIQSPASSTGVGVKIIFNNQLQADIQNITTFPNEINWTLSPVLENQNTLVLEVYSGNTILSKDEIILYKEEYL